VNFHGDIRPLSFVFVESLAHLAMNMATIMSYAAEISTILTFLVTLPAARAYWRKPDRKRPEHYAHRRAGMPDRRRTAASPADVPAKPGHPLAGLPYFRARHRRRATS